VPTYAPVATELGTEKAFDRPLTADALAQGYAD
jgi:hypothetical protein